MKELLRGTDLVGLPVALDGDDIAEVRDVLGDGDAGQVLDFTLNKRGCCQADSRKAVSRTGEGRRSPCDHGRR